MERVRKGRKEMQLMRYETAAAMLGVPISTLYCWVSRRQIPHIRLSRRMVLFKQEELERWLAERRIPEKTPTTK